MSTNTQGTGGREREERRGGAGVTQSSSYKLTQNSIEHDKRKEEREREKKERRGGERQKAVRDARGQKHKRRQWKKKRERDCVCVYVCTRVYVYLLFPRCALKEWANVDCVRVECGEKEKKQMHKKE